MKIIRHGTPQPVLEDMITERPRCSCVFTFTSRESKRLTNNGGGSVYFAKCPECDCNACTFDTGYTTKSEKDIQANLSLAARQAFLRSLISSQPPQEHHDHTH